jgi:predicted ATP-grasp superfamily ATP-dependent carboligase
MCHHWEQLADRAAWVAQPFVQGTAGSLSLLAREGQATLLSVNRQRIAVMDDELVLLGCVVNGLGRTDGRLRRLAGDVAAALPGLWGYAGVDLIATPSGPQVLEVNPRLTTSYAGLRESLGVNPAELVLDLLFGDCPQVSHLGGRPVDVCLEVASAA